MKREILSDRECQQLALNYQLTGNVADLERLFRSVSGLLMSLARHYARHNRDIVDDLFQIGSVEMIKAVESFNPRFRAKFVSWIRTVASGHMRHLLTAARRHRFSAAPQELEELPDRFPSELLPLAREELQTLRGVIGQLTERLAELKVVPRHRRWFVRYHRLNGALGGRLSLQRLADQEGVAKPTLSSALFRIWKKLAALGYSKDWLEDVLERIETLSRYVEE